MDNTIITLHRREMLAKATSGAINRIPPIKQVAFGTGGVDAEGKVIMPAEDQDRLVAEVGRFDAEMSFLSETTVRYTVRIPKGVLDGAMLSEAALVDEDGGLCAIKNMLPKGKENDIALTFHFDDEF